MKYYSIEKTDIGYLGMVSDGKTVELISFLKNPAEMDTVILEYYKNQEIKFDGKKHSSYFKELDEYSKGLRKEFAIPIKIEGKDFTKRVLEAVKDIPYGKTLSYKEVAALAGNEKASRAVGMVMNKNKIPVVIPCHRVVGSNGSLVGFGGGIDLKKKMLELEKDKTN